jgi:hypothetical protein
MIKLNEIVKERKINELDAVEIDCLDDAVGCKETGYGSAVKSEGITESTGKTVFDLHGTLEYINGKWWIKPIVGEDTISIGSADLYELPSELVDKMMLNTLLEK